MNNSTKFIQICFYRKNGVICYRDKAQMQCLIAAKSGIDNKKSLNG